MKTAEEYNYGLSIANLQGKLEILHELKEIGLEKVMRNGKLVSLDNYIEAVTYARDILLNKLAASQPSTITVNRQELEAVPITPEKERLFTLEQMKDAIRYGADRANAFCGYPSELEEFLCREEKQYFKSKYSIEL